MVAFAITKEILFTAAVHMDLVVNTAWMKLVNNLICNPDPIQILLRLEYEEIVSDWGVCIPNPCKNNGICIDQKQFFKCICKGGYTGLNCELSMCTCISV